jgi:general secretion pathway protein K
LITVLWVLVAVTAAVFASLEVARLGADTSRNRILLTRAGWAREACLEVLLAREANNTPVNRSDTLDLGRGIWCGWEMQDPSARLNVNEAGPDALRAILGNDSLADALLDWRDPDDLARPFGAEADWYRSAGKRAPRNGPLASIEELGLIRGFTPERVARFTRLLTVDGEGQINLNMAPAEVLATLPGFVSEAVALVTARQQTGHRIENADELFGLLSPAAQAEIARVNDSFTRRVVYGPPRLFVTLEGGVHPTRLVSRAEVMLAWAGGRLAVLRRMTE